MCISFACICGFVCLGLRCTDPTLSYPSPSTELPCRRMTQPVSLHLCCCRECQHPTMKKFGRRNASRDISDGECIGGQYRAKRQGKRKRIEGSEGGLESNQASHSRRNLPFPRDVSSPQDVSQGDDASYAQDLSSTRDVSQGDDTSRLHVISPPLRTFPR